MTTSRQRAITGLRFSQPYMRFQTSIRLRPTQSKRRAGQLYKLSIGADCREELMYDTFHTLRGRLVDAKPIPGTWRCTETLLYRMDLDAPETKQPGVTYLTISADREAERYNGRYDPGPCLRSCCSRELIETMEAMVGNLGVLMDPDWYQGNWWQSGSDTLQVPKGRYDVPAIKYYGTSNFFMRHPVLFHLTFGMFRQAYLLHQQNLQKFMLETLERKEVEKALTDGDPERALRNLTRIRPWIEVKTQQVQNYPFPSGYWKRLVALHKAIYKHGYEAVFEESLEEAWHLAQGDNYDLKGSWGYWGTSQAKKDSKGRERAKRLKRLMALAK